MAWLLWPDDSRRDGSERLAARRPAMTRPLIDGPERRGVTPGEATTSLPANPRPATTIRERRDMIAG